MTELTAAAAPPPFEEIMSTALETIVADLKGSDRQERIDILLDFAKDRKSVV